MIISQATRDETVTTTVKVKGHDLFVTEIELREIVYALFTTLRQRPQYQGEAMHKVYSAACKHVGIPESL